MYSCSLHVIRENWFEGTCDQVHTLHMIHITYPSIEVIFHSPQNLQDTKKLHIKIESGTSRDNSSSTSVSIRQTTGQDNLSPFSNLHGGETFIPSSDDLAGSNLECKWSTPIARTVKFLFRVEPIQPSYATSIRLVLQIQNVNRNVLFQ